MQQKIQSIVDHNQCQSLYMNISHLNVEFIAMKIDFDDTIELSVRITIDCKTLHLSFSIQRPGNTIILALGTFDDDECDEVSFSILT